MKKITIKNYEDYKIDEVGNIYSYRRGYERKLKPIKHNKGYRDVVLYDKNGKAKRFLIHRLIGEYLMGGIPIGREMNHKNKDRSDNSLKNLEVVTRSDNAFHKYETYQYPRGSANVRSKLTESIVERVKFYFKHNIRTCDISRKLKIHQSTLSEIKQGRTWSHIKG